MSDVLEKIVSCCVIVKNKDLIKHKTQFMLTRSLMTKYKERV